MSQPSVHDTAVMVLARDRLGFVGPLTRWEWACLMAVAYRAGKAARCGHQVELSEYTRIRLGI